MSRPKKYKIPVVAPTPDGKNRDLHKESLSRHADPFDDLLAFFLHDLAEILTHPINFDDDPYTETGAWLISLIKITSPEDCKRMFSAILKAKENAALPPSRQSHCLRACSDFIRETGRAPAKPELKNYILSRPEKFADMPNKDDKKQKKLLLNLSHSNRK